MIFIESVACRIFPAIAQEYASLSEFDSPGNQEELRKSLVKLAEVVNQTEQKYGLSNEGNLIAIEFASQFISKLSSRTDELIAIEIDKAWEMTSFLLKDESLRRKLEGESTLDHIGNN